MSKSKEQKTAEEQMTDIFQTMWTPTMRLRFKSHPPTKQRPRVHSKLQQWWVYGFRGGKGEWRYIPGVEADAPDDVFDATKDEPQPLESDSSGSKKTSRKKTP